MDPALVAGLEVGGLQLAEQGLDTVEVILRMGSLSLGENSELSKATQEDIKEATERARGKLSDLILSLGEDPSGWTRNTILNDEYKLELVRAGINKIGALGSDDPRTRAQATADFTQLGANLILAELAAAKLGKVATVAGGPADDLLPTRGGRGGRAVGEGVAEGVESGPRETARFATPGRFDGVSELSRVLREAGVPRSARLEVINSFRNGEMVLRRATGKENVLRFFGGDSRRLGRFVTDGFPQGDARTLLALPPENLATELTQFRLREGAVFFEGTVGPNFGLPGGGRQIFVPNLDDLVPVP